MAICIYIFSKSILIHVPQLTKKTWTLSVKWKVKLRRHHEIETLHHDLEILDGAQHFLLNKVLKIQRALPIKACDEIALCVLNLRRHWQLCLLCVYSSQSDSPSFILQFWLKTHCEGKKHRQVFLTFTTTKSGFGNDLKKSLCKFMVGKNLRIVAHWWTLRERHLVRLYFNLQWSYFKKSVLHFKLHESVFEYIWLILRCWGKSSMVCQQKSDAL